MERRNQLLALGAAAVIGLGVFCLYRSRRASRSDKMRVSQLWVHPVKSCGGTSLKTAVLTNVGIEYDREWVVVRKSDNLMLKQVQIPRMKLIHTEIDRKKGTLTLSAKGHGSVSVPLEAPAIETIPLDRLVELEKGDMKGTFAMERDETAAWLTDFLGEDVFLTRCYVHRDPHFYLKGRFRSAIQKDDRVQGHDFSPLHVITEEAMQWLRERCGDHTINSERFRANIVVQGGFAFPDEDTWATLLVGEIPVRYVRTTTRCPMICMNDDAVLHEGNEPTATLKKFRPVMDSKAVFGLNMFHEDTGEISVGDEVQVIRRR